MMSTTQPDQTDAGVFFSTGGITLQVRADLPILPATFHPKLHPFRAPGPGVDNVLLHHHFSLAWAAAQPPGQELYRQPPWAIFRRPEGWVYWGIAPQPGDPALHRVVFFNLDHTHAEIYNPSEALFRRGALDSLTFFPTDQILLARLLADRQGCILHAAGMVVDGQGFLFVGHSGAGKSTIVTLLRQTGQVLCDDRIILRRWPDGLRIHGTWSHGDVPEISPASAPLRAIFLLEQAPENRLIPLPDPREIVRRLPLFVVRPLVTVDWWEKTLDLVGLVAREAPVYRLRFDCSGQVADLVRGLARV